MQKRITFKNIIVADIAKNQSIIIMYGAIHIYENILFLLTLFNPIKNADIYKKYHKTYFVEKMVHKNKLIPKHLMHFSIKLKW